MGGIILKKKCLKLLFGVFMLMFATVFAYSSEYSNAQAKSSFTVSTSTKPCNSSYTKAATYNQKTKHYYMLKSYLEKLEKKGGGTLTLNKGTYKIPCTLYVPSNVTIRLKNGATLKKIAKTGTKKLAPGNSIFELVPPSKASLSGKVKKYAGSSNVTITGEGSASINMNFVKGTCGIVLGHNKKVTISGITFKKMYGGSFITTAASKNVSIKGCTFTDSKTIKAEKGRYAIRLEIPDSKTKAFPYTWSKTDNTANKNIKITNNTFNNVCSAVGSVKYTEKVYHSAVKITGNTFSSLSGNAIRALNWAGSTISSNTFSNIAGGTGSYCGIYASGVTGIVIASNTFDYVARPIYFAPAVNSGAGKKYAITYNVIDAAAITHMETNIVSNAKEYYVMSQSTTSPSSITRLFYFTDRTTKDYTITAGGEPYFGHYTDNARYNSYTKDYFMFKSYLEQLEKVGGGTLTVMPGSYSITNTLYVPSNTKIIFKDGVTITKGGYTGFDSKIYAPSLSMFQLVPPSYSQATGALGGYNGAHDISLIGEGTVKIDMLFYDCAKTIVMGHNSNILIQNIQFYNYMGHHFIELDASKNVTIEKCSFTGSCYTSDANDHKEAINIDTPDKNTGGFNQIWTNYDRTPNDNIIIRDNKFTDVLRAIGTHKYSVSPLDGTTQLYHTNIQILNNTITNTHSYAIRSINWKDCVIKGNTIKNVNNGDTVAILMSGTVNPTITENTIDTALRPLALNTTSNTDSSLPDKAYPATHTILDSEEATGKNISDMLNNMLIDIKGDTEFRYYVGGNNKATSVKTLIYKYDNDHIKYTYATPTPKPTPTPTPSQSPAPSEEPTKAPDASATPAPTESPQP